MSDEAIADGKVVLIDYTLKNDAGKVLDTSNGRSPLAYLQGHGNIVAGLEKEMVGKKIGDHVAVVVPAAEGYGERSGPGPQRVKKTEFGKNADQLSEGMPFRAAASDGTEVTLWVTKIKGAWVHIDTNHPLAGETLHFEVEVKDIREATAEELAHGHVHGPHGHAH